MTLEQLLGAALTLLFLADIFLTVLYARAGTGLLAPYWNRAVWTVLRAVAGLLGKRGGLLLSLAGPLIVVLLIGFWALGLTLGAALVIQPELGTAIRPSSTGTPTDFVTALLVAGNSLSIVGGGEDTPHTTFTRLLFLVNSLIGASVLSLVLSYLVQVYSALRERNALALTVHLMTDGTGDAATMLARLMPDGDTSSTTSELSNLARALASIKEAHHFYPLLFYFRFEEPHYAVPRFCLVLLDLTALIGTALDQHRYAPVIRSASTTALRQCARLLLETLNRNFSADRTQEADSGDRWRHRQRYVAATDTLSRCGLLLNLDGVEAYVAERQQWAPMVDRAARALGNNIDEIDQETAK